jgi:peptidoglycan/xylan/chitin deacetylase (PgdA/CDA1 family)
MLGRFRSRGLILLYHRVAPPRNDPWSLCVSPDHFEQHLEVLRNVYRTRLDRIEPPRWRFRGGPSVAITFDDGYADNLHAAARLLKRYDTPATFFIATGYIGAARPFWWDQLARIVFESNRSPAAESAGTKDAIHLALYQQLQPLSDEVRRRSIDQMAASAGLAPSCASLDRALTLEELQALAADDLFEIGAHTVTHPLLAAQPVATQRVELKNSKTWLETFLDRPVTSFSYPYGGSQHYTAATVQAVRETGFSRACTTARRFVRAGDQPWEWGRVHVPDLDGDGFQKLLHEFA